MLAAGDGTSGYQKSWKGNSSASEYGQGTIEACVRLGHWWPAGKDKCVDCGAPNPNGTEQGPTGVMPTSDEVKAWYLAHPSKTKRTASTKVPAQAAKPAAKPAVTSAGECTGTWQAPVKGTLKILHGVASGECRVCGKRVPLTLDSWLIRIHERKRQPAGAR